MTGDLKKVSIIIVTSGRPLVICQCIGKLVQYKYDRFEVIVVDASPDDATSRNIEKSFPFVKFIKSPIMNTPFQRNLGVKNSNGDIIVFIDDDSMVHELWLENLVKEYESKSVGGVGGAVFEAAGESDGTNHIGRVLPSGFITANFNQDITIPCEVEHVKGCNMSFRRQLLFKVGLFDLTYKGTCFCEETDMCLMVRRLGYKIMFTPFARVDHLLAGRKGYNRERFNIKFQYFYSRNTMYFLLKNFGFNIRTFNFIIFDTSKHIFAFLKRIVHDFLLITFTVFGRFVGIFLIIPYSFRLNRKKR